MSTFNRRQFIEKNLMGLGSMAFLSQLPLTGHADIISSHPKHPVGFQVYTIREMFVKDFPGTLKMMANLGYQGVEMCSPPGYITSGFEPLVKMKPEVMRQVITDAGLTCESSHFTFGELKDNLEERIEYSKKLGLTQMICSSFWLPKEAKMSDWLKACDQLNEIGLKTKKAGLQLGFHNHHMEFEKIDGELIYDALLKQFDPKLVKMQFQVAVISIGYKASDYFKKYPGRFISAHLADWSSTENKQVAVGKGIVDWGEFYNAAEIGGVKNFYVEMDMDKFKESVENIHAM
ncbi:MAG: sugar phosphate isomerase/epimerase [Mariniphaga sp.]|nr:sugar phosphate isomerase/epimerase [Mariniphaga sp.]